MWCRLCWCLALLVGLAAPARADIEAGEMCTLRRDLYVSVKTGQGSASLPIAKGTKIEVMAVAGSAARVQSNEMSGRADLLDLEEACSRAVRQCKLYDAIEVQQKRTMDGRAWRIKPGATVSILDRDRNWTRVKVGPVEGYTETTAINGSCSNIEVVQAKQDDDEDKAGFRPFDVPTPTKSQKVVLVPWVIGPGVSEDVAELFEDQFGRAVENRRTDVRGLDDDRPSRGRRRATLKAHLKGLKKPARDKGVSFLVTGELKKIPTDSMLLSGDLDEAELDNLIEEAPGKYVLILAVFDITKGQVLKTVRTEPSLTLGNPWATKAEAVVAKALPSRGRKTE